MDLKQWIMGVLIVMHVYGTTGIDRKVYRCTEVADWKDAMKSCFDSGGTPISHQELTDNSNVSLKADQTFWTADFAVETHEHNDSQSGVDPEVSTECQFATVNIRDVLNNGSSGANKSILGIAFTLENPEFGDCKTERGYICNNPYGLGIPHLYAAPKNWNYSKHKCDEMRSVLAKSGNHTRHGHIYGLHNSSDVIIVWLDLVRTYAIQVANNSNAVERSDIIKHGTYNLHDGFRLIPTGRGHNLTAICVYENASIAEMNLTTDCLEEHDKADVGEKESSKSPHINYILIPSMSIGTVLVLITIGIKVWCRKGKRRRGQPRRSNRDMVDISLQHEPPVVVVPEPEYVNRQELRVVVNSMSDATNANSRDYYDYAKREHETTTSLGCVNSNPATLPEESDVQPRVTSNSSAYDTSSDQSRLFSKRGTLHIYDRTFQDGEFIYDVAK